MFKVRLAILGAAAALALGTAGAMAMQDVGSNNADSHGDAVASAARNCAHGPGGVHGACVSSVARTKGQENSSQDTDTKSSTAPGQVCKAADTDTTETAPAKGDEWAFRLYVVRFGNEVYRFIFASKHKSAEIDRTFREAVNTFRRLSAEEVQGAKPLHLKVVTMDASAAEMARRMAVSDRPLERFLILNGRSAADPPKPGDQVKIIVE